MYLLYKKSYPQCVKLSIPLLTRLLEYAHEESGSDIDLHWILERIISESETSHVLTMEHYKKLIPDLRLVTVQVEPGEKVEVQSA